MAVSVCVRCCKYFFTTRKCFYLLKIHARVLIKEIFQMHSVYLKHQLHILLSIILSWIQQTQEDLYLQICFTVKLRCISIPEVLFMLFWSAPSDFKIDSKLASGDKNKYWQVRLLSTLPRTFTSVSQQKLPLFPSVWVWTVHCSLHCYEFFSTTGTGIGSIL